MSKKNLVIVESPAKAKTISKYLNSNTNLKKLGGFVVIASAGHVRDLPKKELGIDIEKGFIPKYQITEDKKKLVADIIKKAKECEKVWLASDFDREGESIAFHLKEILKLRDYNRIRFTEITSKALETAILNPGRIDNAQVDAQECRRMLDRLVGFKLSPLLWKRYKGILGLSAGRVQSAALNFIVKREEEIACFNSSSYWYVMGDFIVSEGGNGASENQELNELRLYGKDDKVWKIGEKSVIKDLLKNMTGKFKIVDVKARTSKQNPDLPFITSSLQQEAYNKYGFAIKRTMQLAQQLYENGLITYMRTDSYNLSDDFTESAKEYVMSTFGSSYVSLDGEGKRLRKSKNAQEAHEAIRPTNVGVRSIGGEDGDITADHKKLYDLIWKRTVAYMMKPALFDEVDLKITEEGLKGMYFIATFKKCKFNGFLKLYGVETEKYDFSNMLKNATRFSIKCKGVLAKNTWTSPPSRYNESSLIKVLESEGIGRPATFASILAKLYEKQYVHKSDVAGEEKATINLSIIPGKNSTYKEVNDKVVIGAEKTRMVPTNIGKTILSYLEENFAYIIDAAFTAHMEADLDKIAEQQKTRLDVLKGFWGKFGSDISRQDGVVKTVAKEVLETEKKEIKVDGKTYTIRLARYGPVIQSGNDYINLKPYLRYVRKEYTDIDANDIKVLLKVPFKIGKVDGKDAIMNYGSYGYYVKWNDMNVSLPQKVIYGFVKTGEIGTVELKSSIDYAIKTKNEKATQDKSK